MATTIYAGLQAGSPRVHLGKNAVEVGAAERTDDKWIILHFRRGWEFIEENIARGVTTFVFRSPSEQHVGNDNVVIANGVRASTREERARLGLPAGCFWMDEATAHIEPRKEGGA